MVALGAMHGCSGGGGVGACMVALWGGMHGCSVGGMCGCYGGHAWLLLGGHWGHAWLLQRGGMCGCSGGACMVARGVWLLRGGGVRGCSGGVCVVASGGGGCAWDTTRYGNTVNERAVRILLECILVLSSSIALYNLILKLAKKTRVADFHKYSFETCICS